MAASNKLTKWIAESGSWQAYIDFRLPKEERAQYEFLPNYDYFYLSLMSRAVELLNQENSSDLIEEYLSVAKGLEIFSLIEKRDQFSGINQSDNILFASTFYYLSNYSASAFILSKIYATEAYESKIDHFITAFLRRDLSRLNEFTLKLKEFLENGNPQLLFQLKKSILSQKNDSFDVDINEYFSHLLAESILSKFINDNLWNDLLKENSDPEHWRDYVIKNIEKKVPVWSFFPSQKLAIQKGILSRNTCSLQMPTSSGKTSISELIIYDEFKKNQDCRILYLAPYRALASELKQSLVVSLGRMGVTSKTIYGGNLPTVEERTSISNVNLLVSTPEKFMAIEDIFPGISEFFTTIICDEGHLLDDGSRGLSYELLLSRLKKANRNGKRFVFISAITPNISTINKWLGGTDGSLISSDYRPTELEYAFLKKMDRINGYYLDVNPHKKRPYNYQLYKYLFADELKIPITKKRFKRITTKKALSVAVSLKATRSGTVALFAPHKKGSNGVEDLAEETFAQLAVNNRDYFLNYSSEGHLAHLTEYFTKIFGSDYLLTKCSDIGFLFHHGDFPQNIREVIEDSLRENKIRFVICTNTLAEGINLPIKTIVLHSTKRYNPDVIRRYSNLKIRDLKNLVGRAGRAGKESKGMVIVPHPEDFDRVNDLIGERNVEPVNGQLYNIVKRITDFLANRRLVISSEILDKLSGQLQELLDSIDISLIDLLAEEIEPTQLENIVDELVKETLSYFQANENERRTLKTIFNFCAHKLKPIVEEGKFKILKNCGANSRLFNEIINHFDFTNEIWLDEITPLDRKWIRYILDDGIFGLPSFEIAIKDFNKRNKCEIDSALVKNALKLWMKGNWFLEIKKVLGLEMHQVLQLITSFLGFSIQGIISSVIRIKELTTDEYILPVPIANWPSYLQHGVNTQLALDLIEMGLADRVAVLEVEGFLNEKNYVHTGYKDLKAYLLTNGNEILEEVKPFMPVISRHKLWSFNISILLENVL